MTDLDEFSLLADQAADAGLDVAIPPVERIALRLQDGRTLSALRFGDAPPEVTFLHGAGLNAHTWDTTVLALGRPALALDLPGHGDSSWRDDAAYAPRVLAPDVAAALAAWTDRPQLLVGQSLGGLTAAPAALARPESVREVVVVDITPGVDADAGPAQLRAFFAGPADWADRDALVDRALAFGLGGGSREKVARGVLLNSRVRADGRVEWKHHFARLAANATGDDTDRGAGDALRAVLAASGWDDLAALTVPVTLVRGTRGFVTAADADELVRRIPAARVHALASGHNVQEEAPAALAELLRDIARGRGCAARLG